MEPGLCTSGFAARALAAPIDVWPHGTCELLGWVNKNSHQEETNRVKPLFLALGQDAIPAVTLRLDRLNHIHSISSKPSSHVVSPPPIGIDPAQPVPL